MGDIRWRGVIAPLNTADAAGRRIKMAAAPKTRMLPLPLRYAAQDWGGHSGAVTVGAIDRVWIDNGQLWGEGRFDLDDPFASDVVRKIKMGFVRHMSADIEPGTDKLMAATIVDIPAFEQAEIKELIMDDADEALEGVGDRVLAHAFRVVGDLGLPLADREREWDKAAATGRVAEWAKSGEGIDPAEYRRAFFYQDEDSDPALKGSYKLPYADVIDGTLTAVPRAVFAAAGGHGVDAADIPDSDKATIKGRISSLYRKMAKQFDDPSLVAPWDKEDDMESKPKQDDADKPRQSYASAEEQPELVRQLVVQNRIAYAQAVGSV